MSSDDLSKFGDGDARRILESAGITPSTTKMPKRQKFVKPMDQLYYDVKELFRKYNLKEFGGMKDHIKRMFDIIVELKDHVEKVEQRNVKTEKEQEDAVSTEGKG